jgi:arsenite methyltransferase
MKQPKPDYGFDGSPLIVIISPLILVFVEILMFLIPVKPYRIIGFIFLPVILIWLGICISYVIYVKIGKFRQRDAILSKVDWKGNEIALDVGTGRGLLMEGAAKKLTSGKIVGIDIWRQEDMANNSQDRTMKNAELEGVADKVEIKNEDIQKTSFPPSFFDVIVSNLCIHNIPTVEGRNNACLEILRILKPEGTAIIGDLHLKILNEYSSIFRQAGMSVKIYGRKSQRTRFPILVALKKSTTTQQGS